MRNYPEMIKNLNLPSKTNNIVKTLERNNFILKGKVNSQKDVVVLEHSDGSTYTLDNIDHNANNFLLSKQMQQLDYISDKMKPVIDEQHSKTNFRLALGSVLLFAFHPTFDLVLTTAFVGFYIANMFNELRIGHFANRLELDEWFMNNQDLVDQTLNQNQELYQKLSPTAKRILERDKFMGTITLNNIEEFKNHDLRLVRHDIMSQEKKKNKELMKEYKNKRGM